MRTFVLHACLFWGMRVNGFMVSNPLTASSSLSSSSMSKPRSTFQLFAELTDISKMKASEMRKELESYGIPTKSLLEKSEFEAALKKARAEGKKPKKEKKKASSSSSSSSAGAAGKGFKKDEEGGSKKEKENDGPSREERYEKALEEAKSMKVKDLKKMLQDRGISTKSFFEKTEFVKAYAEAVADNKTGPGGSSQDQPYDASYRDVTMQKFDPRSIMGQSVIDVVAR